EVTTVLYPLHSCVDVLHLLLEFRILYLIPVIVLFMNSTKLSPQTWHDVKLLLESRLADSEAADGDGGDDGQQQFWTAGSGGERGGVGNSTLTTTGSVYGSLGTVDSRGSHNRGLSAVVLPLLF